MADRFPALEDFPADQATTHDHSTNKDESNGGDFLAREKAFLGADADRFASADDEQPFKTSATVEDGDDDLLGGGGDFVGGNDHHQEVSEFESSFPAIDASNEQVGPGGTITGSNEPFGRNTSTSQYATTAEEEEEPEVIKQWRAKRDAALETRASTSAHRKTETVKAAQSAVDSFYETYNTKKEKTIAHTRKEAEEFLASREDTSAGGTSWERIAKLVDLSGKGATGGGAGTGKERFREILVGLKKDKDAPGATGY